MGAIFPHRPKRIFSYYVIVVRTTKSFKNILLHLNFGEEKLICNFFFTTEWREIVLFYKKKFTVFKFISIFLHHVEQEIHQFYLVNFNHNNNILYILLTFSLLQPNIYFSEA